MTDIFKRPVKKEIRVQLVQAALQTLEDQGWKVAKVRGVGKGRVRRITKNGKSRLAAIRTTQDTWIAFPRDDDDTKWVTLADVDVVVAVSVDDPPNPKFAQVHMIEAKEMRDRFDRAYAARLAAEHTIPVGRGMWVSLYDEEGTSPVQRVGAGAGLANPPIARVPLGSLGGHRGSGPTRPEEPTNRTVEDDEEPLTIAEAKRRLAQTFGVDPASIKITVEA
jgi:DNA-binding PadR family transcriptional regulator